MNHLPYDGSGLGEYKFSEVIKEHSSISKNLLFVTLNLTGLCDNYCLLKKNHARKDDQIVADELKHIFGIYKTGTHSIRLHDNEWSDYIIYKAQVDKDKQLVLLTQISQDKSLYEKTKRVLVFRDLIRSNCNLKRDLAVKTYNISGVKTQMLLSFNESITKTYWDRSVRTTDKVEKHYFPFNYSRAETLVKMLNLTPDNYQHRIEVIKHSVVKTLMRLGSKKLWLADNISTTITNQCSFYFTMKD